MGRKLLEIKESPGQYHPDKLVHHEENHKRMRVKAKYLELKEQFKQQDKENKVV